MRRPRRLSAVALVSLVVLVVAACQPAPPPLRPVRSVLLLGDSISWGVFTATPSVREPLVPLLRRRNIRFAMIGGPGDTPVAPWPGREPWDRQLEAAVEAHDPDVVIVQTMLFPGGAAPEQQALYREASRRLFEIASSRGARVLRVTHPAALDATVTQETFIAQALQAEAAAQVEAVTARPIGVVALNGALDRCRGAFLPDRFHLSAAGERCHANAIVAAIDEMRRRR